MTPDQIAARLDRAKQLSDGRWIARCPAHQDRMPSLSMSERDGTVLIKCHAGCDTGDILAAIGLRWADLFPDGDAWRASEAAAISLSAHQLRKRWQPDPIAFERRILEVAIAMGNLSLEDRVRVELAEHRLRSISHG